jgi:TonB family protein
VDKGLDESAMQTLRTWKFKPAMKKGKTVPVRVVVEVSFKLF